MKYLYSFFTYKPNLVSILSHVYVNGILIQEVPHDNFGGSFEFIGVGNENDNITYYVNEQCIVMNNIAYDISDLKPSNSFIKEVLDASEQHINKEIELKFINESSLYNVIEVLEEMNNSL
ncbi:hypothetical protein I4544_09190 [Klebsiella michiganensis]|uniref:hypothetical protein n=1 Tax=Klebsiella michiganensis TaxID=1134687 RepID=UPI0018C6AABD|nr:hypothetical protein [Klebsiella michiganensis]ELT5800452.1 hypothetical protein [Klebsiella variicola]MBG2586420.1 hypothetical protein [Klebsiella michiganensis]